MSQQNPWLGLWNRWASRLKGDIIGTTHGSPQHRGDALNEELDVYLELLFQGSDKLGGKENAEERTEPAAKENAEERTEPAAKENAEERTEPAASFTTQKFAHTLVLMKWLFL